MSLARMYVNSRPVIIELQMIEYFLIAAPRDAKKIIAVPYPPMMAIRKNTTFFSIDSFY